MNNKNKLVKELGPFINIGWQLALTIILMVFLGKWLDEKFDTSPWLIVTFSLFGIIAGMVNFLKTVLKKDKDNSK